MTDSASSNGKGQAPAGSASPMAGGFADSRAYGSQSGAVRANADGTTTIWFGPEPPPGEESNWVPTVRGKGWFTILRLYGPLDAWFDKAWRPGEIEAID